MIKRKLLYEQVKDELVQRIKSGDYEPGQYLPPEKDLAEEFKISRNCIREALKSLSIGGLVQSVSGRGSLLVPNALELLTKNSLVIDFSDYNSLVELMELRLIIEPKAAALAAQRAREPQIKEMQALLQDLMGQVEGKTSWEDTGLEIHRLVAQMTGNHLLMHVLDSLRDKLLHSRHYLAQKQMLDPQNWQDHKKIFEAIKAHDPVRAEHLMLVHIEHSRDLYLS